MAMQLYPVAVPFPGNSFTMLFQKLAHTPAPEMFIDRKVADAGKVPF